jgi:hypothetical protein
MSEVATAPEPPQDAVPPARSLAAILGDLYFAPSAAFADIARAPRLVLPLVVLVVLNLAFTIVWASKVDIREFMRAQIEASGQDLPPEQMENVISMQEKIFKPMAFAGAALGAPIVVMLLGALFRFVYRSFFASDLTFRQSAAVVAWSLMTVALVTTPLLFAVFFLKGDWTSDPQQAIRANPSLLLEKGDVPAAVYTLAGSLDLFTLWILFLMAVGYGVVVRRPASQTIWGVGSLWLGYVLVKVLWAAVRG